MFQNAPPAPTIFSKKVFPPRGGWIVKHIRREPVSEFPPHKKVFDAWGVDYETGPFTYCSLCPPQQTGGGNLKQVALGPVSLSTPHQKGFDAWGVDYETGLKANCFRNPPPKILKGLKDIFE